MGLSYHLKEKGQGATVLADQVPGKLPDTFLHPQLLNGTRL